MWFFKKKDSVREQRELLTEQIREVVRILDYAPRFGIEEAPLPIKLYMKPQKAGVYLVNTERPYSRTIWWARGREAEIRKECSLETAAVIIVSRAVRKRMHLDWGYSSKKLREMLLFNCQLSEDYRVSLGKIDWNCCDPFDTDAELISRFSGALREEGHSLEEIAQMIKMPISESIRKYGLEIFEDSIDIQVI